jgi:LAO/AO transport system kinase
MPRRIDPAELADETRLGRLLSAVENDPQEAQRVLAALPPPSAPAHRVGVTGSPGVGKSTLLNRLIAHLRRAGHCVGVVAVDPTSPLSGGAILADRLRLSEHQTDPGVYIRSLGSRGSLGGVTPGASAVAAVLEAAGYARVLIETVGVGQTGYDVICLADSVVVLLSPEGGDAVQLLKAGILEIGDVFAVNKSDRPGAEAMLKEVELNLDLAAPTRVETAHHGLPNAQAQEGELRGPAPREGGKLGDAAAEGATWRPPALRLVAQDGEGVDALAQALEAHRQWLAALPEDHPRRRRRLAREIAFVLRAELARLLDGALAGRLDELAAEVQEGRCALWHAVALLREEAGARLNLPGWP